ARLRTAWKRSSWAADSGARPAAPGRLDNPVEAPSQEGRGLRHWPGAPTVGSGPGRAAAAIAQQDPALDQRGRHRAEGADVYGSGVWVVGDQPPATGLQPRRALDQQHVRAPGMTCHHDLALAYPQSAPRPYRPAGKKPVTRVQGGLHRAFRDRDTPDWPAHAS